MKIRMFALGLMLLAGGLQGCKQDGVMVSVTPDGKVVSDTTINCSSDGVTAEGICGGARITTHTLTAEPAPGYRLLSFVGGGCAHNQEYCIVTTQEETINLAAFGFV